MNLFLQSSYYDADRKNIYIRIAGLLTDFSLKDSNRVNSLNTSGECLDSINGYFILYRSANCTVF